MTDTEARDILTRVRAGDKTPTSYEINAALIWSGDITVSLSTASVQGLRNKADKKLLTGFSAALDRLALSEVNFRRLESIQRAAMPLIALSEAV